MLHNGYTQVEALGLETQLLNIDDEISRAEMHVFWQRNVHRDRREIAHDRGAVGIDEIEVKVVLALVGAEKRDTQRDRALRMNGGKLLRVNRVKGAEEIQLAVVIGRRVAQHCHLNIHPAVIKTGILRLGTN